MDNQALVRLEALRKRKSSLELESRMRSKAPVRFGKGRLGFLNKGARPPTSSNQLPVGLWVPPLIRRQITA